jgi:hypothetical protein
MNLPAEPGALLQFQLAVHEKTREYCRKSDKKMSYTIINFNYSLVNTQRDKN